MQCYKVTMTMTYHMRIEDVVEYLGPNERDIKKHPELMGESPDSMVQNQIDGAKTTNEGAWEPHALEPQFESKFEVVEVPDERILGLQTMYRLGEDGRVESERIPDPSIVDEGIKKMEEEN